eukprot:3917365-Prymnesium_polylepis.1
MWYCGGGRDGVLWGGRDGGLCEGILWEGAAGHTLITCRTRATSTRPEYSSWRVMKSTSHSPAASFWLGLRPV